MHIISNQILQIYKHFLELREVVKALESEIRLCHLFDKSLNLFVLNFFLGKIPRNEVASSDGKSSFKIVCNCQQCHFAFLSAVWETFSCSDSSSLVFVVVRF